MIDTCLEWQMLWKELETLKYLEEVRLCNLKIVSLKWYGISSGAFDPSFRTYRLAGFHRSNL